MRRTAIIIVLALAGCASDKELVAKDQMTCEGWGSGPGTGTFLTCMSLLQQERGLADEQASLRLRQAGFVLQTVGRSLQSAQPTTVTCQSMRFGTGVQTTCQ